EDITYEERACEGGRFATVEVTDKAVDEALREAMPKIMKYAGGTNDQQFGGYAKETDYITHANQLRTALEGTPATYQSDVFFCTGYDPPMKPYGRRNEVWLVKA
uniref:Heme-binding protein 1 n=1 Tax=Jaculus jaculus TaxID=51337 RepID=A0A8C5P040_JACJA